MKKIFLVIVLLIAVFTTIAQPLCQIEHFTVNNGLAQGVVTTILQDKKDLSGSAPGMVWTNLTDIHSKTTRLFLETVAC